MLSPELQDIALKILLDSIRFKTFAGNEYEDIVEYYAEILSNYGLSVSIHRIPDDYVKKNLPQQYDPLKPRYILIARTGYGDRVLQFNGHYDVVPPGEGWSTDPFVPRLEGDRIYGRGSSDMKGGIAAFLATMIHYAKKEPGIIVEGTLVPDEEIGGVTGTGYLIRELKSKPDWTIIAEPSGLDNIWIGHRGNAWFLIHVYGVQSHGSTPWLGDNAFEKMIIYAKAFLDTYREILATKTSNYTYDDPRASKPSITPGGILMSPGAINIVPGEVAFSIDRRLIVEESINEVVEEFNKIAMETSEKTGIKIRIELVNASNPALTSPDSFIVKALQQSIRKNTGREPRLTICTGGLDLKYYSELGLQAVAYGPGEVNIAHKPNEYIKTHDLRDAINTYIDLVAIIEKNTSQK